MGENNGHSNGHTATPRLKTGLAEMLKGGVSVALLKFWK